MTAMRTSVAVLALGAAVPAQQPRVTIRREVRGWHEVAAGRTFTVGVDPMTGRLHGAADIRRERTIVVW
jgi:hypothetical protein